MNPQQSARMQIRKEQYLGIIITRMCNGHFLQNTVEDGLINAEHLRIIEELKDWLAKILPTVSLTTLEREAKEILRFLIVEGWLVENDRYIDQNHYITQLNEHFYTELSGRFALSQELLALLTTELTNIHYQLLSFSFSSRCSINIWTSLISCKHTLNMWLFVGITLKLTGTDPFCGTTRNFYSFAI